MISLVAVLFSAAPIDVGPVPASLRRALKLSPFYAKAVSAGPLPVLGSRRVADAALREARDVVLSMLVNRPDLLATIASQRGRFVVMAPTELTTDMPEYATLSPKSYWDRRARGLGATLERPAVSCGEENLLEEKGDPYVGESICVHEFAHTVLQLGVELTDSGFRERLSRAFQRAKEKGPWKGTYAMENEDEYWAEAVQSWFDTNLHDDSQHGPIDTREEVLEADPEIAALIVEVFGDVPWRYRPLSRRQPAGREHLGALPQPLPRFAWPKGPRDEPLPLPKDESAVRLSTSRPWPKVSPGTRVPAVVNVVNQGAHPITWDWVGFDGELVRYATIPPGSTLRQPTWIDHVWVVSRRGEVLGWFSAPSGTSSLTVR